jgi:benzoylformate decarboxylase
VPAEKVDTYDALVETLDRVVPTLADRSESLVLEVPVIPDPTFQP